MSVTIAVRMHAPVFAAGTCMRATVTLYGGARDSANRTVTGTKHVQYVVVQVAGRWTSDRAWIIPNAHPQACSDSLDLHDDKRDLPWDAALDDANRVGGGGRQGYSGIIFRSSHLKICSNESLPPGSKASFTVQCVLPDILPATFRGSALRYSYSLNVVASSIESRPQYVRVPFRVVGSRYFDSHGTADDRVISVPTPRSTGPVPNRFLDTSPSYALAMSCYLNKRLLSDDIDDALAVSSNGRLTPFGTDDDMWKSNIYFEDETPLSFMRYFPSPPHTPTSAPQSPRSPTSMSQQSTSLGLCTSRPDTLPMYQISKGALSLARMYLLKRVHHLGDTLTAIFEFRNNEIPCYRLNARLECQEIVQPSHCLASQDGSSSPHGIVFRKLYGEHDEFVLMNHNSQINFSIPHDAPVSFATSAVNVRWLLHFIFLIPRSEDTPKENGVIYSSISTRKGDVDVSEVEEQEENRSTPLLAGASAEGHHSETQEVSGWEGGDWNGDDPNVWKEMPEVDADALKWTLPLRVTGSASRWGDCPSAKMSL